jgi:hypothetical protein
MRDMSSIKRKIPVFKVSIMGDGDYTEIINIPEVKEVVLDEVLIAIKEGVVKKKKSISLFSLANTDYYVELDRQEWSTSLNKALDFYVNGENYSKCIECRDLINKIKDSSYGTSTRVSRR